MDKKQIFGQHYKRLFAERIIKSVIAGATACFGINTVFSIIYWMFGFGGVWLGVLIGIPAGIVCSVFLYFLKYKLTKQTIARRVDRGGKLEERMVTMVELDGDDSYIAELQRNDAIYKLANAPAKSVKLRFSAAVTVVFVLFLAISLSFNVLGVLAKNGKIPYGKDLFAEGVDGAFDVVYITEGGGYIRGEAGQKVNFGESTSVVRAIADDGWKFVRWNDGETSPERSEENVTSDMVIKAVFEKIDSADPDEDDNDTADDLPSGGVNEESGGGDSNEEGGDNIKDDGQGNGSGKWQDRNQFIDGATYYRDYLEFYYQYAMGVFDSETEIPPEIIEFFETYFSGI